MMPTTDSPTPPTALVVSSTAYKTGQTLDTPRGQPDIVVTVITPLVAILIRAAKAYIQTLVGLLAAGGLGMASSTLPAGDFVHTLKVCAGLSVASGVMSLLTNVSVLLTALGDRFPILKT
jgi:hypothetical protein